MSPDILLIDGLTYNGEHLGVPSFAFAIKLVYHELAQAGGFAYSSVPKASIKYLANWLAVMNA